jgi:hypothetical protein
MVTKRDVQNRAAHALMTVVRDPDKVTPWDMSAAALDAVAPLFYATAAEIVRRKIIHEHDPANAESCGMCLVIDQIANELTTLDWWGEDDESDADEGPTA